MKVRDGIVIVYLPRFVFGVARTSSEDTFFLGDKSCLDFFCGSMCGIGDDPTLFFLFAGDILDEPEVKESPCRSFLFPASSFIDPIFAAATLFLRGTTFSGVFFNDKPTFLFGDLLGDVRTSPLRFPAGFAGDEAIVNFFAGDFGESTVDGPRFSGLVGEITTTLRLLTRGVVDLF